MSDKDYSKSIADNLGWCAVWLFLITLNTCSNNLRFNDTVKVEIVSDTTTQDKE